MKRIVSLMLILALTLAFAACSPEKEQTAADPTAAPTAEATAEPEVTEAPTAAPTEAPTEAPGAQIPEGCDEHDYTILRDFFEQKDENGVTNGSKCFPIYDPDHPMTWFDGSTGYDNYVGFDDDGKVFVIKLRGVEETIHLVGTLTLSEFEHLATVFVYNAVLDEADAADLPIAYAPNGAKLQLPMVQGEAVLTGACCLDAIYIRSASHVLCDITGEAEGRIKLISFRLDVTSEGEGYAGISAYDDENYYVIKLTAEPMEGRTFVGWFDSDGKLVSADAQYELFGEHTGVSAGDTHAEYSFTARFE